MHTLISSRAERTVIGMIHLAPLPGTPFHEEGSLARIIETAVASARALRDGGAHGGLVQTVDRSYDTRDESDPARTVAMGLVLDAVVRSTGNGFVVGCQLMRNATRASLAATHVASAQFVRAGALVGATQTASGLVQSNAHEVAEYRRKIGAMGVAIVADIHSMQFRWFGEPRPLNEVARLARQAGADAVAIGTPDDDETLDLIRAVRRAEPALPIWLAGYTHHRNAARMLAEADGAFVGTCLERDGWAGRVDEGRVADYMALVRGLPPREDIA